VSENSNYDDPIPSERLKKALYQATAVLGRAAQDAVFYDLELEGIAFNKQSYTLRQIHDALKSTFGEGSALLMKRLEKELKEQ